MNFISYKYMSQFLYGSLNILTSPHNLSLSVLKRLNNFILGHPSQLQPTNGTKYLTNATIHSTRATIYSQKNATYSTNNTTRLTSSHVNGSVSGTVTIAAHTDTNFPMCPLVPPNLGKPFCLFCFPLIMQIKANTIVTLSLFFLQPMLKGFAYCLKSSFN